jgi:hypothetical protein
LTGTHKVGDRDGRQQADDRHDYHDLNQGETGFTVAFHCFHFMAFYSGGGTQRQAD